MQLLPKRRTTRSGAQFEVETRFRVCVCVCVLAFQLSPVVWCAFWIISIYLHDDTSPSNCIRYVVACEPHTQSLVESMCTWGVSVIR